MTNQDGKKVDANRHGGIAKGGSAVGGAAPRVVHRVGMECLSPINVSRGDGPSTGGEFVCCVLFFAVLFVSAVWDRYAVLAAVDASSAITVLRTTGRWDKVNVDPLFVLCIEPIY